VEIVEAELERALAPEPDVRDTLRPLFVLRIEDTWLAVDAALVDGVLEDLGCSPVPGVPAHVLGVITHGNQVLAVLDVARFCALPPRANPAAAFSRTVVVSAGPMSVAIRADVAAGVVEVPASAIKAATVVQGASLDAFLAGECETPWGVCGLLDVPRLLDAARVRE
jgi:chemotaxis signal transduction protein